MAQAADLEVLDAQAMVGQAAPDGGQVGAQDLGEALPRPACHHLRRRLLREPVFEAAEVEDEGAVDRVHQHHGASAVQLPHDVVEAAGRLQAGSLQPAADEPPHHLLRGVGAGRDAGQRDQHEAMDELVVGQPVDHRDGHPDLARQPQVTDVQVAGMAEQRGQAAGGLIEAAGKGFHRRPVGGPTVQIRPEPGAGRMDVAREPFHQVAVGHGRRSMGCRGSFLAGCRRVEGIATGVAVVGTPSGPPVAGAGSATRSERWRDDRAAGVGSHVVDPI